MTHRTESNPQSPPKRYGDAPADSPAEASEGGSDRKRAQPGGGKSPTERAIEVILAGLNDMIAYQHKMHHVPVPEKEFRRIFADYLESLDRKEMHELLHAEER